jgi:CYTH domain-containing protein
MAKEIERKYLVKNDIWNKLDKPAFVDIHQGYLINENGVTVRVRYTDKIGTLTIKSKQIGISRDEFEYEIPLNDAKHIFTHLCKTKLVKKRYYFEGSSNMWEVDEYLGKLEGLIIAEVELNHEAEIIKDIPNWLGEEVSFDNAYSNASLASKY